MIRVLIPDFQKDGYNRFTFRKRIFTKKNLINITDAFHSTDVPMSLINFIKTMT